MYTFDASSMIYAWENYPIGIFPPLWKWMAERIGASDFTMPQCAYDECDQSPDLQKWLNCCTINRHPLTHSILGHATAIKASLNIRADSDYHTHGVGENDIFIISTAKDLSFGLVSNEAPQALLPNARPKYKIPAVCFMPHVAVRCIPFIDLLNLMSPNLNDYAE